MGSTLAWRHGRSDPQKLSSGAVSAPGWSLAAARGIPMRKVLRQRGGSRSTFYRRVDVAVRDRRSGPVRGIGANRRLT